MRLVLFNRVTLMEADSMLWKNVHTPPHSYEPNRDPRCTPITARVTLPNQPSAYYKFLTNLIYSIIVVDLILVKHHLTSSSFYIKVTSDEPVLCRK